METVTTQVLVSSSTVWTASSNYRNILGLGLVACLLLTEYTNFVLSYWKVWLSTRFGFHFCRITQLWVHCG